MVDPADEGAALTRMPTRADLVRIASKLNQRGARYAVLGGMAMIEWGLRRSTMGVDLLVEASERNIALIRDGLAEALPERAAAELTGDDVVEFVVVRINDDITVDVMASACGVTYADAHDQITVRNIDGVNIPFASPELLLRTKATCREKDALDRSYLKQLLAKMGGDARG